MVHRPRQIVRVAVTQAARRDVHPLLFQLSNGDVFGPRKAVIIHAFDMPSKQDKLQGIAIEIEDCSMDTLKKIMPCSTLEEAFKDIDAAFLFNAVPSEADIFPRDELSLEIALFKTYGIALNKYANKTVLVLIIGRSANTNALICSQYAPSIEISNFTTLSQLHNNIAKGIIGARIKTTLNRIDNVIIWGNSSKSNFPDPKHGTVFYPDKFKKTISMSDAVKDDKWLRSEYIDTVHERYTTRIHHAPVTFSIAGSQAAVEHMRTWWQGTEPQRWISMGVPSDGSYGVPEGIFFSFPVYVENRRWKIVKNIFMDTIAVAKVKENVEELLAEKKEALNLSNLISKQIRRVTKISLSDYRDRKLID